MSTVILGTLQSNSSSPPTFNDNTSTEIGRLCRAFVNFNGTGTVAIRGSFNVRDITDNGTGDYTVNFINALPDANYATVMVGLLAGWINAFAGNNFSRTTTANRLGMFYQNSGAGGAAWAAADPTEVSVAIFR